MTDKKENGRNDNAASGNTKDIAEILRMLRESVGKPIEAKSSGKLDEGIEEKLREKVDAPKRDITDAEEKVDPASFEASVHDEEDNSDTDQYDEIDPCTADDSEDDDAPWYSDDEDVAEGEEASDADESEDDDAPWYSDDEDVTEDEETSDADESEDDDAPWNSDNEDVAEDEEASDDEPIDGNEFIEERIDEILDAGENTSDEAQEISDLDETVEDYDSDELKEAIQEIENEEIPAFEFDDDNEYLSENNEAACNMADDVDRHNVSHKDADDDFDDSPDEEDTEIIAGDAHLDKTDLSVLEMLGYNSSVGSRGDEFVVEHEDTVPDTNDDGKNVGDVAFDYDGGEYLDKNQSSDILAGYKRKKKSIISRLTITAIASLMMLIYEILVFRGVSLPWIFNQYEFALSHIMFSVQLLVIVFAVSAKNLTIGLADLIMKRATPYSISAVVLLVNLVYSVFIAILLPESYLLFNFVAILAVLLAVVYEYLLICHEENTFRMVSANKKDSGYAFEEDGCSGEVIGEHVDSLRAYRTKFNKNYFTRTKKRPNDYRYLGALILTVVSLAFAAFVISIIINGNVEESLKLFVVIVDFSAPLGVLGTFSLPIFMSSSRMLGDKAAVIGHSAADEYAGVRFVTFDESDLFPTIKASHIDFKPTGDLPVSEILRMTGLMFSVIGGPISKLVEIPGSSAGHHSSVTLNGVFDDGVSATVEDSEMLAGSAQFLALHGVRISSDHDSRDGDGSKQVLYISINGTLSARYYIKYRPDRDFVKAMNMLGDNGIAVGIRTRNPGVNSDIIARRCPDLKYRVYTIKNECKNSDDLTSKRNNTESGLFAREKAIFLAYPLLAAKRMRRIYAADRYLRIVFAALGGIAVIIMAAFGLLREFNSVQAAAYQLACMLPTVVSSLICFGKIK